MYEERKRYIKSLNALRGFAMLGVFFAHAGIWTEGGYYPTFFIILSGFFAVYTYVPQEKDFLYGFKKIFKFYPVHVVCFVVALMIRNMTYGKLAMDGNFLRQSIVYNLMIQSFIPDASYYFAFNAVEWFLSVLFFCYLVTPVIIKILPYVSRKFYLLYIFQILYIRVVGNSSNYVWWCSVNPLFRVIDYIYGCILCYSIQNKMIHVTHRFEIIGLFSMVAGVALAPSMVKDIYIWSLICVPLFVFVIWSFYADDGTISQKCLNCKFFQLLGNISFEVYMIHQLIMRLSEVILGKRYIGICLVVSLSVAWLLHELVAKIRIDVRRL